MHSDLSDVEVFILVVDGLQQLVVDALDGEERAGSAEAAQRLVQARHAVVPYLSPQAKFTDSKAQKVALRTDRTKNQTWDETSVVLLFEVDEVRDF